METLRSWVNSYWDEPNTKKTMKISKHGPCRCVGVAYDCRIFLGNKLIKEYPHVHIETIQRICEEHNVEPPDEIANEINNYIILCNTKITPPPPIIESIIAIGQIKKEESHYIIPLIYNTGKTTIVTGNHAVVLRYYNENNITIPDYVNKEIARAEKRNYVLIN